MQLSVLIANCHLQVIKRPHVKFDEKTGLKDESNDNVMLIFQFLAQLESVCMKSGKPWPFAAVEEQGSKFSFIKEELEDLRKAARTVSDSTEQTLQRVSETQKAADQVSKVQKDVVKQTEDLTKMSNQLNDGIEKILSASEEAAIAQSENEKRLLDSTHRLVSAMANIPKTANLFEETSKKFEELMHRQETAHTSSNHLLGTANTIGLLAFVVTISLLVAKKSSHVVYGGIYALGAKKICSYVVSGYFEAPFPIRLLASILSPPLSYITEQVLYFVIAIGILWTRSPSPVREALVGDTLQRTIYTDRLAEEQGRGDKMKRERDGYLEQLDTLRKQIGRMAVTIETKQSVIDQLEILQQDQFSERQEIETHLGKVNADLEIAQEDILLKEEEIEEKTDEIETLSQECKKNKTEARNFKSNMNALKIGESILKARIQEAHSKILQFEERETKANLRMKEMELRFSRMEKQDPAEGSRQKLVKRSKSFRGPHGRVGNQEDEVDTKVMEREPDESDSDDQSGGSLAEHGLNTESSGSGESSKNGKPSSGGRTSLNTRVESEGSAAAGNHLKNIYVSLRPRRQSNIAGTPQNHPEIESSWNDNDIKARLRSSTTPREKRGNR